jgi:hypothetical protein
MTPSDGANSSPSSALLSATSTLLGAVAASNAMQRNRARANVALVVVGGVRRRAVAKPLATNRIAVATSPSSLSSSSSSLSSLSS